MHSYLFSRPLSQDFVLTIKFDSFVTEKDLDVVDIYTGGSTLATSHFVSSLSANPSSNPKPTFVSTNHLMIVVFSSDGGSNFQGFSAHYYTSKLTFSLLRQDYTMLCLYFLAYCKRRCTER